MSVYVCKKILLMLCMLGPVLVFADMEIIEIMYNPKEYDDGYEYVRIKNTSSQTIDTSLYYFFENGTYHGLYPENNETMDPGSTGLIVKDILTASSKYGSENYIKSSFSLNNTGETLSLADSDKNIFHTIHYNTHSGNGDGNPFVVDGGVSTNSNLSNSSDEKSLDLISLEENFVVQDSLDLENIPEKISFREDDILLDIEHNKNKNLKLPLYFLTAVIILLSVLKSFFKNRKSFDSGNQKSTQEFRIEHIE